MITEITKGQLLALQLGRLKDQGRLKPQHVSMGKRNNVWVARECAKLAREILGANGIVDDYPVIRHMLNIESVYTYEGTHDIHGLIIGEAVTGIPAYNPPERDEKPRARSSRRRQRRPRRERRADACSTSCSSRTSSASPSRRPSPPPRPWAAATASHSDQVAVEAMRREMDTLRHGRPGGDRRGRARQGADALRRRGGRARRAARTAPLAVDIAVDPLEGTNLCATGAPDAIAVLAAAERGGLLYAPDVYMEKIVVGPTARGVRPHRRAGGREPAQHRRRLRAARSAT